MHRSRLSGFIIDCRSLEPRAAADFWGAALGLQPEPSEDPAERDYLRLGGEARGLHIEVQRVLHESRVHLDIETDDVEAEVRRLEKLGARRISRVRSWWVLEAPTGHRFCVVPADSAGFAVGANLWSDDP